MTNKLLAFLTVFFATFALGASRVGHYDSLQYLDGVSYISVRAPSGTSTWTMVLPPNDGNANQVLTSDGAGVTTWTGPKANTGANSDITSLSGLTTPLSLAQGGTAATSASGARTSLSAAVSGANNDITSLTGLTTPLSVGQGGTGSATAGGARTNLSAASSGANSDITSLSGLTTALSIAQGGTGQTSATAAFNGLDPLTTKGDLVVHDGTNSIRIAVGTDGQVLTADSTQTDGIKWAAPSSADPLGTIDERDDFLSGSESSNTIGKLGWHSTSSGTGANLTRLNGVSGHPGILRLVGGTTNTSRAVIQLGETALEFMVLGDGSVRFTSVVRLTGTLTQFARAEVGLSDGISTVGNQTDGVFFQILGGASPDTNWFLVTRSSGTQTRLDTGLAFSSAAWVKFEFTVNAAGTIVQGIVNGTNLGSTVTTNIPTAVISPFFKTDGLTGGAATNFDVDFFRLQDVLTTTR